MSGSVTNTQQPLPLTSTKNVATGLVAATGDSGLDGTEIPYSFLADANNPGGKVPLMGMAQDGTDPVGTNAGAQAGSTTVGVGLRGWLSTLVGLFQNGTAKVESNHYGTPSAGASVSVGITSTSVLASNGSRKFLSLTNDSNNTIYVDLSGAAAVSGKGVRLNANGGSVALDRYVPTGAITAIASAASSNLCIQEG